MLECPSEHPGRYAPCAAVGLECNWVLPDDSRVDYLTCSVLSEQENALWVPNTYVPCTEATCTSNTLIEIQKSVNWQTDQSYKKLRNACQKKWTQDKWFFTKCIAEEILDNSVVFFCFSSLEFSQ